MNSTDRTLEQILARASLILKLPDNVQDAATTPHIASMSLEAWWAYPTGTFYQMRWEL
jgi:hypothetical protein